MRLAGGALHLDAEPDAVARARHYVADALRGTKHADLIPDAELAVSELVTNAVLHAVPPIVVRVRVDDTVRIEVEDASRTPPVRPMARPDSMTGRGLALVAALSSEWGVEPRPEGKAVWCVIAQGVGQDDDGEGIGDLLASWDDDLDETGPRRYVVSLGDVPTGLLLAAKAHVDNVIREFTLAAHGAEAGSTAALPAQLAGLIDEVLTRFAEPRQAIKRQALEAAQRGADRTRLTLHLPVAAADAGERYLEALDEVDTYARAARLLTLETPPQHRIFRRWYVESLVAQLRAAAHGHAFDSPESFEERLLGEVAASEKARRAAERAARLQEVTAALAATTTGAEVGQVVVSEGVASLGASGGGLLVAEGETLAVTATVGYAEPLLQRLRTESRQAELPAARALRTGEAVWLESREERDNQFPELTGIEPGTISICAVPLCSGDRVLGALRFSFDTARLFDDDERRFVLSLAGQTSQALERAEALAAAARANERLAFLGETSEVLANTTDLRAALAEVERLAVPRLADSCAIRLDESSHAKSELRPTMLVVPLAAHGRVYGTLSMANDASGRRYDESDLALAEDLARRVALTVAAVARA